MSEYPDRWTDGGHAKANGGSLQYLASNHAANTYAQDIAARGQVSAGAAFDAAMRGPTLRDDLKAIPAAAPVDTTALRKWALEQVVGSRWGIYCAADAMAAADVLVAYVEGRKPA
jgi:hypothetical protein